MCLLIAKPSSKLVNTLLPYSGGAFVSTPCNVLYVFSCIAAWTAGMLPFFPSFHPFSVSVYLGGVFNHPSALAWSGLF
jgi:hypothetical protein